MSGKCLQSGVVQHNGGGHFKGEILAWYYLNNESEGHLYTMLIASASMSSLFKRAHTFT